MASGQMHLINNSSFLEPLHLVEPGSWLGHIPFASWLVSVLKPDLLVELGTHTGNSYLALCQAVKENNITAKAYAVDTWQGDEHAGKYDDSVFLELRRVHDPLYGSFSELLRMTFDQAVDRFPDGSIDLLHIDGLHTYEAVKHDFENWLPKVSKRGVVLFHDTNVYEQNFGVYQLWAELVDKYPGFNFKHCHGLGVLLVGEDRLDVLNELIEGSALNAECHLASRFFEVLGKNIEKQLQIASLSQTVEQINELNKVVAERDEQIASLTQTVAERDSHIADLLSSTSWRITRPLRAIQSLSIGNNDVKSVKDNALKCFDCDCHLKQNPDVAASGLDPDEHYMSHRKQEGRQFKPGFFLVRNIKRAYVICRVLPNAIKQSGGVRTAISKAFAILRREGFKGISRRVAFLYSSRVNSAGQLEGFDPNDYAKWIRCYDTLTAEDRVNIREKINALSHLPLISVIMPTYNPKPAWLIEAIESVQNQLYSNWELCIADDASTDKNIRPILERFAKDDPRIKVVFREQNGHISATSNSAIELASGDWIALLDHDDTLPEHSLFHVAKEINEHPNATLIYSDEDKINEMEERCFPHFKPDLNLDLLLSQNYICHLLVIKTNLLTEVGGFRKGYEGAQDHDLVIRCIERIKHDKVRHITKVLYHWRMHKHSTAATAAAKEYTNDAGIKMLNDYIDRNKLNAMALSGLVPNSYRIKYAINGNPLVSIIIPTKDQIDLLKTCIDSIENHTTYRNYEIIIVNNRSIAPSTTQYFQELSQKKHIRIIDYDDVFNYSNINNYAIEKAGGEYICLMNNDIEVISPEWLEEMLSQAIRPEIGCVGAKLYYPNNKIQHGGVILGIGGVAGHSHKCFDKDASGYHSRLKLVQNISAVTAACLVVSKDVFIQVGGFDGKNLKVAFNDIDFCLRIRNLGLSNLWSPYAELYHHESISRGQEDTPEKRKRFQSEISYMTKRWGKALTEDPYYNPNLSKQFEDFSLKL